MFWLRAFAVFLALMVIAPVQAAVLTAPRVAVAGGPLVAVGGITALIRRGQLLPAGAYVLAGVVAAIAAVCEPFIAVPHAAGSGTQWDGACLALFMAIPAVMMNRRFARRCAAAGVSPSRPVQAARIPPLSGVTGVRSLRVHLGWWAPVLLIIQIVTSAALLCLSGLNTILTPLPFGGWIGKVLDLAYGRTRHDLHDRIGRTGGYRGRPRLVLFAGLTDKSAKVKVRSDALRWGEWVPTTVHFSEYLTGLRPSPTSRCLWWSAAGRGFGAGRVRVARSALVEVGAGRGRLRSNLDLNQV